MFSYEVRRIVKKVKKLGIDQMFQVLREFELKAPEEKFKIQKFIQDYISGQIKLFEFV